MNADCRAGLQALASPQDRWDVYRAVSAAIERASPGSAGSFQAAVHDRRGNITVREDQQAFAEIARSALAQAADTVADLIPHLYPDLQSRTPAQALDAALAITDELDRAQALAELAPHLPAGLVRPALDAAFAITDGRALALALAGLAPILSPDQLAQALDAATAITDDFGRAEALAALAPHLPGDLQTRAMQRAPRVTGNRWRVFVSHTSELRDFPKGTSYVAAVERAISAAGHVVVGMADFPGTSQAPAQLCIERVRMCDVYVGVLGTRYGSPVRDRPEGVVYGAGVQCRHRGGHGPAGIPAGHRG